MCDSPIDALHRTSNNNNYWGEPERAPHLSYCCAKSNTSEVKVMFIIIGRILHSSRISVALAQARPNN